MWLYSRTLRERVCAKCCRSQRQRAAYRRRASRRRSSGAQASFKLLLPAVMPAALLLSCAPGQRQALHGHQPLYCSLQPHSLSERAPINPHSHTVMASHLNCRSRVVLIRWCGTWRCRTHSTIHCLNFSSFPQSFLLPTCRSRAVLDPLVKHLEAKVSDAGETWRAYLLRRQAERLADDATRDLPSWTVRSLAKQTPWHAKSQFGALASCIF